MRVGCTLWAPFCCRDAYTLYSSVVPICFKTGRLQMTGYGYDPQQLVNSCLAVDEVPQDRGAACQLTITENADASGDGAWIC
jgi:hypothetical protein